MAEFALPSIEECRAFHAKINEGRVLIGLEPLDALEFDTAEPGDDQRCLSATNLFAEAGYLVGAKYVYPLRDEEDDEAGDPKHAVEGILVEGRPQPDYGESHGGQIPPEIKTVTDCFDRLVVLTYEAGAIYDESYQDARAALRARLVEAGVVAPERTSCA